MDFINVIGTFYDNSMEHVVALTKHIKDLRLDKTQEEINEDIYNKLENSSENKGSKGFFNSFESLQELIIDPKIGDWAVVQNGNKQVICTCEEQGIWTLTENEYKQEINLENYAKKSEFKTINNQSILGEGNIDISAEGVLLATPEKDGLMSKESYQTLQEIRSIIIPQIEENIENLQNFINDDTNVQDIIKKYYWIKEFIENLESSEDEELSYNIITQLSLIQDSISQEIVRAQREEQDIKNSLSPIQDSISQEIVRAQREEQKIKNRLNNLESNSTSNLLIQSLLQRIQTLETNSIKHKFITQQQYDSLDSYEKNTIYFITDSQNSFYSVFGENFPIILK